jgi:hypothetical protein
MGHGNVVKVEKSKRSKKLKAHVKLVSFKAGATVQLQVFVTQDNGAAAVGSDTVTITPGTEYPVTVEPVTGSPDFTPNAALSTVSYATVIWPTILNNKDASTLPAPDPTVWIASNYRPGGSS